MDMCGSYDTERKVLTLLKFSRPEGPVDYVNGQWGEQEDAFNGDVINAYNDGPVEDGSIMGPFYEIETSSPGAALSPENRSCIVSLYCISKGMKKYLAK